MKIAITGYPGSGKTTFVNKLKFDMGKFHTDDFIEEWAFKELPTHLINHLRLHDNYVIKGVQVARMLRTGAREGTWIPDLVIWMEGGDNHNRISSTVGAAFRDWMEETGRKPYYLKAGHYKGFL